MPDREHILYKIRGALGHRAGQEPGSPPAPLLRVPSVSREQRVEGLLENFPGEAHRATSPEDARLYVARILAGRPAVAFDNPLLDHTQINRLPGVRAGIREESEFRQACATAEVGITGAQYALMEPGALVMVSGSDEERLASLLPSTHIAVISADAILTGLDELFTVLPDPAAVGSSVVLIAGPSRTGDIEMILVKGVHGPRELHLVVL